MRGSSSWRGGQSQKLRLGPAGLLTGPAGHFDPVSGSLSGLEGPRLTQSGCESPAGGEGLWPGWGCSRELVPVCTRSRESGQTAFAFVERKPKPEWSVPRPLGCRQDLGLCPEHTGTHCLAHMWPVPGCAPSLGLFHREMGWRRQLPSRQWWVWAPGLP